MTTEQPDEWPDEIQPKGLPKSFDYRADKVDAANVKGIDADTHGVGCPCGCKGDALIISEPDADGAYIASTMSALRYIGSKD
jgi:hypothetical protein